MNRNQRALSILVTTLLTTTAAFASNAHKGEYKVEHKGEHKGEQTADSQATAPAPMTDGEVKKIDRENGKITIKHGEIKSLDMPPMTMVFRVQTPALLEQLKVGDKINFAADKIDGKFTVTKVEAAK